MRTGIQYSTIKHAGCPGSRMWSRRGFALRSVKKPVFVNRSVYRPALHVVILREAGCFRFFIEANNNRRIPAGPLRIPVTEHASLFIMFIRSWTIRHVDRSFPKFPSSFPFVQSSESFPSMIYHQPCGAMPFAGRPIARIGWRHGGIV